MSILCCDVYITNPATAGFQPGQDPAWPSLTAPKSFEARRVVRKAGIPCRQFSDLGLLTPSNTPRHHRPRENNLRADRTQVIY